MAVGRREKDEEDVELQQKKSIVVAVLFLCGVDEVYSRGGSGPVAAGGEVAGATGSAVRAVRGLRDGA